MDEDEAEVTLWYGDKEFQEVWEMITDKLGEREKGEGKERGKKRFGKTRGKGGGKTRSGRTRKEDMMLR